MNTEAIKIFNSSNELNEDFESVVESVLKEVHGEVYYDTDEDFLVLEPIEKKEIEDVKVNMSLKKHVSIKDFIPVLFFILIFGIITLAGYYFLNNFDFTSIIK